MTVLAKTTDYLVEYESNMLTIARYSDGHCLALTGRGIAGEFRACLKTHAPDRVIQTFMRMIPDATWRPLYKPERMEGQNR
jgi:hypothetical protein